ncbi:hypothetical protein HK097_003098 [Rhizophlyctis rosea]|uniref:EF-hand domain-containing protein n=1 Tax=Rhizophlyctis rosea TaxID=64517 RepID=A0AAD5SI33_9FUNG|nr:hypothetical protein HK097_003098 [Rhizophlyctis rosea]
MQAAEDPVSRRLRIRSLFDSLDDDNTGYLEAGNITRRFDELAVGNGTCGSTKTPAAFDNRPDASSASSSSTFATPADGEGKPGGPLVSSIMYARELVKECDKTKDGRITFAEFEQFVKQKELELWRLFQQIDRGGDGLIQPGELRASLRSAGIDISDSEFREFLSQVDVDNDGVIDFFEWRDFLLLLPHKLTLHNVFKFYNGVYNVDWNTDSVLFPDNMISATVLERMKYFLAGGVAGAVSRTATAPLDRLKVLLVNQTSNPPKGLGNHIRAIRAALSQIYQDGGISSFYRGNGLNIVKIVPESALKFFVFEYCKSAFATLHGTSKDDIGVGGRFMAGGMAGLVSQAAIYPLETIKTRIMSQIPKDGARANPAGMERVGLGSGNFGTSLGSTPGATLSPIASSFTSSPSSPSPASPTSPSSSSAHQSALPSAPSHSHSQPTTTAQRQSLFLSTTKEIWREGGLKPFYRGCVPSLIGIVPYAGIDLAIFETLKQTYTSYLRSQQPSSSNDDPKPSMAAILSIGMISGAVGATMMYPLSVVRTRLQAQGTPSHPDVYAGAWDCCRRCYKGEGLAGFYKGLMPTLLKVLPAVSISYGVYERVKRALDVG